MKDLVISASDPQLIGEVMEEHRLDAKQVVIDGDYIVINGPYQYEIHISQCSSPDKILDWVRQLAGKQWVTTDMIRRFIAVARNAKRN